MSGQTELCMQSTVTIRTAKIPRWVIGGDPAAVARAQGDLINYAEWQELCALSLEYPTLKKLLDTLVTTYYTVKEYK